MNLRKCWLEALLAVAASLGVIGIVAWLNMAAISLWWSANWWWIVAIVALATSHQWFTPLWRAYLAISDRVDMVKMRRHHHLMLAVVTAKLEQGFDTTYKNAAHGFEIGVHNPYARSQVKIQEVPGQALLAPVLPKAPVYREVDGLITAQRLVLCYTQDGPIFGTVLDLLSMCVVGKPGRGKSTALLYYILILLKAGAEVWIWDPHSGLNELSYGLNYRDDLEDIEQSCATLHRQLEQRRNLWKEKKQVMHPLLLLVDEMPVIADYEDTRAKEQRVLGKEDLLEYDQNYRPSKLLKKFVLEARKWNCYVILSGQALPAEVLNTLTRDNMSSRIVFESCNMHAKMAGLQKEEIDSLLPALKGAGPGVAVMDVSRWSKPVLAAIPNTTVDDLRAFIDSRKSGRSFSQAVEHDQDLSYFSANTNTEEMADESEKLGKLAGNLESATKAVEKIVESVPEFSEDDEKQIIQIARVQLATYGRVIRSKIPPAMQPTRNNSVYPVVKYICDREQL